MVLIDLFSGIGGMAGGLMDAGFEFTHHYFSEIDKHAIAVYKYRFPNAKYIGSVKDVSGRELRNSHPNGQMGCIPSARTENKVNVLTSELRIRRLTEIECERLQGFPDNHTQYGNYDGEIKKISKTQRYKQMGNAVTKKIVTIIGKKLRSSITTPTKVR